MKKIAIPIVAFIAGILPGFFIVFNAVFTDSSGAISERLITFLLVIAAYGIFGIIFGLIRHRHNLLLTVCLSLPAAIILFLYTFKEPQLLVLNVFYILLTLVSAWAGLYAGTFLRTRVKGSN